VRRRRSSPPPLLSRPTAAVSSARDQQRRDDFILIAAAIHDSPGLADAAPAPHIESVGQLLAAWAAQSAAFGMLDEPTALLREHAERGVA
jgi:hypothetical protein